MDGNKKESCNLEAELLKSQNAFNDILKSHSQLEKHCISLECSIQLNQEVFQKRESCDNQNALEIPNFFENNDLKAQLQDKDSTICKLKDIIKSLRDKSNEENDNYDYGESETKNVKLENSVAKLSLENERLYNEINHMKRKETTDIAAQKASANSIVPGIFKLHLEPLVPMLLQHREAHIDYLKYTQKQVDILRGIVKQAKAKQPLDNALDFALVPNLVSQQPCIPPNRDDWDHLFQPMFDEYFNPPTFVVSPVLVAAAPRVVDLADSLLSTSIDQDAPLASIPSTQEQEHSLIISQGFEETPKKPTFHDDSLNESPHEDSTSQGSLSNVLQIHTLFKHLGRWTKDHIIANVIADPSHSVSTRKQIKTDAMWCYFDAFLTSVEPKNFKQAMTELSWIDAMSRQMNFGGVQKNKARLVAQGFRLDLIYAICLCARYQAKSTEKYLNAIKRIFRYLKGAINMGLCYLKDTGMSLTAYAYADHAGCQDTRRSTSGSA
nr:uncharacterized mitochondrial protein AtMg00810-like [Tanacetum cinerariifolium]